MGVIETVREIIGMSQPAHADMDHLARFYLELKKHNIELY